MGKANDREHFDDYRQQTQVKHDILAAYLPAYFNALKQRNRDLLFVDGFAGRGTYTEAATGRVVDGSPLRTLKLIAENSEFAAKVSTIFIEADNELYRQMEQAVSDFATSNSHVRSPRTVCSSFKDGVESILANAGGKLPPTFLFVDPCGVAGTSFDTIRSVLACPSSEAFIFFNIDGIRRIAGLDRLSPVLIELLGSERRAKELFDTLQKTWDVTEREQMILMSYRRALREDMGVKYTIPFRVESEDKQKTSHFLIHATKHALGFTIMKEVMWNRGRSQEGSGALEFVQASGTSFVTLFGPQYDTRQTILAALVDDPKCVDLFYKNWVCRPDDMLCQPAYREALLRLESDGEIEVLEKDARTLKPAHARKKYKGKPTLGEGYFVRLVKK